MTQEELIAYQRDAAALIMAALVTGRSVKLPPPPVPEGASEVLVATRAAERAAWETARNMERMHLATEAFALAGALSAEATLWAEPADGDGAPLDPKALDPSCTHGRRFSEPCDACAEDHAGRERAASAGNSGNSG